MLRKNAWLVVGLLWFVALLNYLDRQLIVSMDRPIKEAFKIGNDDFGLITSMFLWVYGLCSPLAGYVADRVGSRRVILFSLTVWSIATLLTGYVNSFEEMLAARAIMGISEACYIPAALALIVDYHQGRTRSRATGLHLSGTYAGSVLGGLGGWIAAEQGWRFGFQLFGLIGVGYAVFLAWVLPAAPARHHEGHVPQDAIELRTVFASLLCNRSFVLLLTMNAAMGAAYWTIKNWLPVFFRTEIHIDERWAPLYGISAFFSAAFVGMLAAGTIADHWSQRNPRARLLVPGIMFCIAAPCFFMAGFSTAVPVLLAAVVVVGMGQGALDANLMPSVVIVTNRRYRATGYGMLNFVGTTTGGVVSYVGGRLTKSGVSFGEMFQGASAFILVAGLLLFAVRPRED